MLYSKDICVITPTKGRHHLLRRMLESLYNQSIEVGQVIIADGGRDAEYVIDEFKGKLPIEWLDCPRAGQIPQREFALKRVKDNIRVIIFFDDDIVQSSNSLENLVRFWNSRNTEPAAVSFNLSGGHKQKNSIFRRIFLMQISPKGTVLASGYNTPITDIKTSIKTQWVLGGATAWRREILDTWGHSGIASKWAICEDLIYSYPISKSQELFVCADAKVEDIDIPTQPTLSTSIFRGRNSVLWRYYFVSSHPELSKTKFFWMMLGQVLARITAGLIGNRVQLGLGIGHIQGIVKCAKTLVLPINARDILE